MVEHGKMHQNDLERSRDRISGDLNTREKQGIEPIRKKISVKFLDEYANIFRGISIRPEKPSSRGLTNGSENSNP